MIVKQENDIQKMDQKKSQALRKQLSLQLLQRPDILRTALWKAQQVIS